MRRVVNGKIYDTASATLVAEAEFAPGSLNGWYEALYCAKGSFFLYGEGGPMTKYGRYLGGNTTGGGSEIVPLTPQEALAWCEERQVNADIVEKWFGELLKEA